MGALQSSDDFSVEAPNFYPKCCGTGHVLSTLALLRFLSKYLLPVAEKFLLYWVSFWIINWRRTFTGIPGGVFQVSWWELKQVCFTVYQKNSRFLTWLLLSPTLAEKLLFHSEMEQVKIMNFCLFLLSVLHLVFPFGSGGALAFENILKLPEITYKGKYHFNLVRFIHVKDFIL